MNYLFTFDEHIDVHCLAEFNNFCWELNEITVIITSANDSRGDGDDSVQFPPNFIIAYADTENEGELETITHFYHKLCLESPFIETTELTTQLGQLQ